MRSPAPFVIIGGGQAGAWVAKTLRAEGYTGRITLLGAEPHAPYERPPLSKAVLTDPARASESVLLSQEQAVKLDIELRPATRVAALDPLRRQVRLDDGSIMDYEKLFLATGSQPRLPDWYTPSSHTHMLRTVDDAAALHAILLTARRLLIVGGGWIGLEVAATARQLGVDCVIVEAADRVCARSVPPEVSVWLAGLHRDNGVVIRTSAHVVSAVEHEGQSIITLSSGVELSGDALLIGIGNVPDVALAAEAGLEVADGVVVDEACRTSDPHIFASGDVASFTCMFSGSRTRRESWANAQNQAIIAAKAALGQDVRYADLPWLWSDQYGHHIQILGSPERAALTSLHQGVPGVAPLWSCMDENGHLIGAIGVDANRELRPLRKTLAATIRVPVA